MYGSIEEARAVGGKVYRVTTLSGDYQYNTGKSLAQVKARHFGKAHSVELVPGPRKPRVVLSTAEKVAKWSPEKRKEYTDAIRAANMADKQKA